MIIYQEVKIKLSPPKSKKYLYSYNDYENFEFRSPINPWNVEKQYISDFDKKETKKQNLKWKKNLLNEVKNLDMGTVYMN